MPSSLQSTASASPQKGTYAPSRSSDLRSPCPMINALANHGYLPRDGRNVHVEDFLSAMDHVGLSGSLGAFFAKPLYLERSGPKPATFLHQRTVLGRLHAFLMYLLYLILNPWAILFSSLALRKRGQKDAKGRQCLNLDQLATHGIIEHDISLTRHDYAQGNNHIAQPDLVRNLLNSSSDGGKTLSLQDLATLRKNRIAMQKLVNPHANYGAQQHVFACTEIGLVLGILGDGESVPQDYVRALFHEERLPTREGWKPRRWWKLGMTALTSTTTKVIIKSL